MLTGALSRCVGATAASWLLPKLDGHRFGVLNNLRSVTYLSSPGALNELGPFILRVVLKDNGTAARSMRSHLSALTVEHLLIVVDWDLHLLGLVS